MRKWFLRGGGVVLVLLIGIAGIVGVNTVRYGASQPEPTTSARVTEADRAAAQILAGALRFPTVSRSDPADIDREAYRAFLGFLEESFPRVHRTLRVERINDLSLLYTWKGTAPERPPILLTGHYDVVPVEPGARDAWRQPPFAGRIVDGEVWGRGALDDKIGVIGVLHAVETLLAQGFQPERTVMLAFGHDEEVGGRQGASRIAAELERRGLTFDWMLDEGGLIAEGMMPGVEPPVALIQVAEKGYVTLALTASAAGGHSSMPPRSTAAGILATAIHRLERNPMPGRLTRPVRELFRYTGPFMGVAQRAAIANQWLFEDLIISQFANAPQSNAMVRTTLAPTVLRAGVKDNVLPARARALVNARLLPGDSPADVVDHVRRVIDDPRVTIEVVESLEAPGVASVDTGGFRRIAGVVRGAFPDVVVAPSLLVATTDSRHYSGVVRNIYRFRPNRMDAERLDTVHGQNERVSVENVAQTAAFYRALLAAAAGPS